jgi:FKBP12-rapamycin complex-associated protein
LDLLSVTLSGKHYNPVGAPLPSRKPDSDNPTTNEVNMGRIFLCLYVFLTSQLQLIQTDKNPELIKLALNTLGSFDFSGKPHDLALAMHQSDTRSRLERVRSQLRVAVP